MLLPTILLSLLSVVKALDPTTVFDANGFSLWEKIEAVERQLLNTATLNSLVTPCSFDFNNQFGNLGPSVRGQQTSAEWIRTVFHDVITKNVAGPGLG